MTTDDQTVHGPAQGTAERLARLPPRQRAERFRRMAPPQAVRVFEALDPPQQCELVEVMGDEEIRELVEDMEPDDRVRLLDATPAPVSERLLAGLTPYERDLTRRLLEFPRESAGRIMSPEVIELTPEMTVAEALAHAREEAERAETVYVLPVRDGDGCLAGVVELRELFRADGDRRVDDLVDRSYPQVSAYEDQEPVARLIQEENLIAVPVVDRERRLLGLVTVDDAMEVLEQEETEDISRQAGGTEPLRAPYFSVPVRHLVRTRIVWLFFLVGAATLTVTVLDAFEGTLEQAVTLALFVPLLIGTGGNCGAQAATTMTRAVAVGDVRFGDIVPSVLKEGRVGISLGLLFAVLGFLPLTLLYSAELAAVVSLTLLAICTWATSVGAVLPLVATKVGIDPAVVSAPLVTTLVDATGLLIYFGIAEAILI